MVDFRRWILVLAIVSLFAGLASAQVGGSTMTCAATVAVPPLLRAEGVTDLIGDIVLTCSGGPTVAAGTQIPTANITVSLGTNVTSRILAGGAAPNTSITEALLLIDEPGGNVAPVIPAGTIAGVNFGPLAPQTLCSTPNVGAGTGGCVQFAQSVSLASGPVPVASLSSTAITAPVANVFQGIFNSLAPNQIQFLGISVLPPVSNGFRIFRINNVRANIPGVGGSGLAGTVPLSASVSISSNTSILVNNPVLTAGFIQTSLSSRIRSGTNGGFTLPNFGQCTSPGITGVALLEFDENFATAWKPRSTSAFTNSGLPPVIQNIPGQITNTESGFIPSTSVGAGLAGNGFYTGLADFGTRLKATFRNIPSGLNIYVSTTDLAAFTSASPATPTGAVLVTGATVPDTSTTVSNNLGANIPQAPATNTLNNVTSLVQLTVDATGTASAAWEVIGVNPAQLDTYRFGVYISFTSTTGINTPVIPAGSNSVTSTVSMTYAPTISDTGGTATAFSVASNSLVIPRFVDLSTPANLFSVSICQTVLLFPYVINVSGFDTGLAISNTTSDPFGTKAQVGTCGMNFYGSSPPTTQPVLFPGTGTSGNNILTGTTTATLASTAAPGFAGYMIATCNFSLAHGFAFVSDVGARNLAMGYLALVVPTGTGNRNGAGPESLAH